MVMRQLAVAGKIKCSEGLLKALQTQQVFSLIVTDGGSYAGNHVTSPNYINQ